MLRALRRFFDDRAHELGDAESPEQQEHALRLATAALLFEVVRADGEVRPEERAVMRTAIHSAFDLPPAKIDELVRLAEEASLSAVSVYEFTHLVDKGFPEVRKKRIVELLWLVAFADAQKDALEEQLVRKIAGLLHVEHPDFIDAKIRARNASSAARHSGG
jgi:uncharacterized tellurite resistance protein B-like protein